MDLSKKKTRKLTPKEKKALLQVESNAGVGWDYPKYKRTCFIPSYEVTDPIRFEEGKYD